jgi:hypothetical protein
MRRFATVASVVTVESITVESLLARSGALYFDLELDMPGVVRVETSPVIRTVKQASPVASRP